MIKSIYVKNINNSAKVSKILTKECFDAKTKDIIKARIYNILLISVI